MRRACARDRLSDDRPMSRLSDSSVILTSQIRVWSIILMLLLIQMANMSNLSLCQKYSRKRPGGAPSPGYTDGARWPKTGILLTTVADISRFL